MSMTERRESDHRSITAVLLFGGLWGLAEATLGFLLHLLPRVTGMPPMAGLILFPVGVCFMLAGVRQTGRPATAFRIALVAAAVKVSSVAMAPVTWVFVQNPVVSILLEGAVVWLIVSAFAFGTSSRWTPVQALAAAAGWRVLFVLAHLLLGLQWGLLQRGTGAVVQFIAVDSLVNSALITTLVYTGVPGSLAKRTGTWLRPVPAGLILVIALVAEHSLALL